jgi:surface polysaccharide O-acyltransferase-like enzyme
MSNVPLGYLRTFLTLLVVAHHAVLAYHPYAPPRPKSLGESMIWGAFPVVDTARWPGIELFVGFNDTFFMSLMFLISGVFAWSSLERKGGGVFFGERARKLGVAFAFSAAVLAPLAYYPTYLSLEPQTTSFVRQWLALDAWPAGPAWFLWVLLALAGVAALVHPRLRGVYLRLGRLGERPAVFFAALVGLAALAYLPMAAVFTSFHWASFGPFFVQTSRIFLYAVYFFAGIALGAHGLERGLLSRNSTLARRWPLWVLVALFAFAASLVAFVVGVLPTLAKGGPGPVVGAVSSFAFVLSCAASSFLFLGLFVRFARTPSRVMDSLSANAFGIYLVHYACVSWLQLALLPAPLSGAMKGTLVFIGAVLLSWGLTAAARRVAVPAGATIRFLPVRP